MLVQQRVVNLVAKLVQLLVQQLGLMKAMKLDLV